MNEIERERERERERKRESQTSYGSRLKILAQGLS